MKTILIMTGVSIFVLAYGTAMLNAIERRAIAAASGRKHSQTGEPLVEFDQRYKTRAKLITWAGGIGLIGSIFYNAFSAIF